MSEKYIIIESDINYGYYCGSKIKGEEGQERNEIIDKVGRYMNHISDQFDMEDDDYNTMVGDVSARVFVLSEDYLKAHENKLSELIKGTGEFPSLSGMPGLSVFGDELLGSKEYRFRPEDLNLEQRLSIEEQAEAFIDNYSAKFDNLDISQKMISKPGSNISDLNINISYKNREIGNHEFICLDYAENYLLPSLMLISQSLEAFEELKEKAGSDNLKSVSAFLDINKPVSFFLEDKEGNKKELKVDKLDKLDEVVNEIKLEYLAEKPAYLKM